MSTLRRRKRRVPPGDTVTQKIQVLVTIEEALAILKAVKASGAASVSSWARAALVKASAVCVP